MKKLTRRDTFRWLGISIGLPVLDCLMDVGVAHAQFVPKKRFIGCFFPSGAAMPSGANGDWIFGGALKPLETLGLKSNVIVARGFRSVRNNDVHWTGTAGFMSCNEVGLYTIAAPNRRAGERCGKSFDQYVADLSTQRIRSLHAGYNTVPGWDESHDSQMSIQYVNCIAWKDERTPIKNQQDPTAMFTQVFGDGTNTADPLIRYQLIRRKSVLDGIVGQLNAFRKSIPAGDRAKMDAYESGIREIEGELSSQITPNNPNICQNSTGAVVSDPNRYLANIKTMQKIIVKAMQCDATRAATVMYNDGIGETTNSPVPRKQHDCAHNNWDELKKINLAQVSLWGEMIKDLKDLNLLNDTVLILGSNMSDGMGHVAANSPFLIASAGTGLKLGQEVLGTTDIANESANRVTADIYMDLFKLFGTPKASYGEGRDQSTGLASGILT